MTTHPATVAMNVAQTVFEAKRGRQFSRSVREFVDVLRTVPDFPAAAISAGSIQVLQYLGERVIEQIEQRLAEGADREGLQQELAAAVYDIRSALEEVDRWHRRFAGGEPARSHAL
jgi:hypothetical protein